MSVNVEYLSGNYYHNRSNINAFIGFISCKLSHILKEKNIVGEVFLPSLKNHTDNIQLIDGTNVDNVGWNCVFDDGLKYFSKDSTDGVIISDDTKNKTIAVFPGDCPIVSIRHQDCSIDLMGMVHAGRRGLSKNIVGQLLLAFESKLGKNCLSDLILEVSPFAYSCCYEFGKQDFNNYFVDGIVDLDNGESYVFDTLSKLYGSVHIKKQLIKHEEKYYLNIKGILNIIFQYFGIKNVIYNDICTICKGHNIGYYSSRLDKYSRFGVLVFDDGK